jgi:hypothetical protein
MAKAAVAAWAACIKDLQQQLDTAGAVRDDAVAFCQRLEKLNEQPPLPHAVWKKLVLDVQVNMLTREGCQAGIACAAPATRVPREGCQDYSGSMQRHEPRIHLLMYVCRALKVSGTLNHIGCHPADDCAGPS